MEQLEPGGPHSQEGAQVDVDMTYKWGHEESVHQSTFNLGLQLQTHISVNYIFLQIL